MTTKKSELIGLRFLLPKHTAEKLHPKVREKGYATLSDYLRYCCHRLLEEESDANAKTF